MQNHKKNEHGYTLLLSLFILALLSIFAFGALMATSNSLAISANENKNQSAFYLAEAGVVQTADAIESIARSQLATQIGLQKYAIMDDALKIQFEQEYFNNIAAQVSALSLSHSNFELAPDEEKRHVDINIAPKSYKSYEITATGNIKRNGTTQKRKLSQIIILRDIQYDSNTSTPKPEKIPGVSDEFFIDPTTKTITYNGNWDVKGSNIFPNMYDSSWTLIVNGNLDINNQSTLHFLGNILVKGGNGGKEIHFKGNSMDLQVGGALYYEGTSIKANSSDTLYFGALCAPNAELEGFKILDKKGGFVTSTKPTDVALIISSIKTTGGGTSTIKISGDNTTGPSCSGITTTFPPSTSTTYTAKQLSQHIDTEQPIEVD